MPSPKFALGQVVEFQPTAGDLLTARGAYRITRALPAEGNERTYRAEPISGGPERVLPEGQLLPASEMQSSGR